MHLGCRIVSRGAGGEQKNGRDFHHARSKARAHDMSSFTCRRARGCPSTIPRFGFMKIVPRAELDQEPSLRSLGLSRWQ